ncbi:MAG: RyR domain-containing protein [Chthoniobacterales bacterium]
MWHPTPDKDQSFSLPGFLDPLIEKLAEKVHDRWAERRLEEGWTLGKRRDDAAKTTPNLVAYDKLTETEKAYDRATAIATIKNLYTEGYRVVPDMDTTSVGGSETKLVETFLADPESHRLEEADALWRSQPPDFWGRHPQLLLGLARFASNAGWPLLAYDMASRTLTQTSADGRKISAETEAKLRHLAVLSLMEVGALERAAEELGEIRDGRWIDGDLEGLRGRLAKMRGLRAATPEQAKDCFLEAGSIYASAYRDARARFQRDKAVKAGTTAYYLGINAATMNAWAGDTAAAATLADEVLEICDAVQHGNKLGESETAWLEATRGEAHLLRGATGDAGQAYRAAARALHKQWRPLQSMRRQALETARRINAPREEIETWFKMPQICVRGFPGLQEKRPPKNSIVFYFLHDASQLENAANLLASCSEFHLGFEKGHACFRASLDERGAKTLDKIESSCTRIIGRKDQFVMGEQMSPVLARLLFRGAVLLRAQELDLAPSDLPPLDRCRGGGTFRALLCAEAKGYSRLDQQMLQVFVRDFLGCIGKVIARYKDDLLTVKTAGDGLFAVFRSLDEAVRFSLELRDAVAQTDWGALGLPPDLGLRITLDAGPMLEITDPVTGRTDVAGRLVNRAARIEPITPVNHVYASRTLASLALALGVPGVRFEYAGETPLPKGFGAFQLYHLTAA